MYKRKGLFTLSSGTVSDHYYDMKMYLLQKNRLFTAVDKFVSYWGNRAAVVGGPSYGAALWIPAILMECYMCNMGPHRGIILRQKKEYGLENTIVGENKPGTLILVDDVITTGANMREAANVFKQEGYDIVGAAVLIEREEGILRKVFPSIDTQVIHETL